MKNTPWTPEQVKALNEFQQSGRFHPFTCGGRNCPGKQEVLVATENGWKCPKCDYTQDWAHGFMTDAQIKIGDKDL